ncbi:Ulp1 family isopeptidase [Candidatus Rickettsia colombianensi]|uniref:Ulp1 family isopeptidase n=1 Tax=Candidatus Rickettsia colombianensi TaxID=1090944 RepID=UPI000EF283BC
MAEPIIFTLLLGDKDRILEKINKQETQNKLSIIRLEVNKASHISDKERIFSEILQESREKGKTPIFNIQLNNNNVKPIFRVQDLINSQNLNIKTTITFNQYNSLPQNSELEAYWKQIMEKVDHVFFTNEADQNLAIADGIVPKDKTTTITDISLVTSVFNNLVYDRKIDQLLSGTIPDKEKLDKIIKNAKNQGGRVIIETWPLSADEATNLITAKFGITSEDQIYGLKLEINEILKDPNNAAENFKKYISQISRQFQKDLGKAEINPIDFNFNTKKVMNDSPKDIQVEQTTSYEPPKENQPQPQGFFRRVFNYFKDIVTSFKEAIFDKKEELKTQVTPTTEAKPTITEESLTTVASSITQPQQYVSKSSPVIGSSQKQQDKPFSMTEQDYKVMRAASTTLHHDNPSNNINDFKYDLSQEDLNNIKKPEYWYTENDIVNILTAALDDKKVSIQPAITLANTVVKEEMLKDLTIKGEEKERALAEIQETKAMFKDAPEAERNNVLKDLEAREKIITLPDEERKKQSNALLKEAESKQKINTDILNRAAKDIQENGKECAVIPIEMGTGHWCNLFMTHSKEDNQTIITFNDSFGHPIGSNNNILPDTINKAFENKRPPLVIDEQIKQQNNNFDCGPYSVETMIRKASGKPILTESEALNKGPELREKHAQVVIDKQQERQAKTQLSNRWTSKQQQESKGSNQLRH